MRKTFITLFSLLLYIMVAAQPIKQIREVQILAELLPNGDAWVTQAWDVEVGPDGTEFYMPIGNLGPMEISNLHVWDDDTEFESQGRNWDVDRSRSWKKNKCGIVPKKDGVELCWGLGDPGDHVWTVLYYVSGLVQGYDDADGFTYMFVNEGLDPAPQKATVTIVPDDEFDCPEWTYDNTRVWGFGYSGDINVVDGGILAQTDAPMQYRHRLIATVKFEKGMFQPHVEKGGPVQDMIDAALDGSAYGADDDGDGEEALGWLMGAGILGFLAWFLYAALMTLTGHKWKPKMFGRNKIVEWYRETPLEGNLLASNYVLSKGRRFGATDTKDSNLIGAFFLRWIMDGHVGVQPDPKSDKRVNLVFQDEAPSEEAVEKELYQMARAAAGGNKTLEKGEFEKWSARNYTRVMGWPERARSAGLAWLRQKGLLVRTGEATLDGQKELSHVIEFKNFLKNFTLSDQRDASEVKLWKDYLVYAQLFGIADKVTKQFKKLYPKEFDELARQTGLANSDALLYTTLWTSSISNRAFSSATAKAGSVSGTGGRASCGGGGGFSGGGFGGGGR